MKRRTPKLYTVTVISRLTGRKRTWHTDKRPPDNLIDANYYVRISLNRPVSAAIA